MLFPSYAQTSGTNQLPDPAWHGSSTATPGTKSGSVRCWRTWTPWLGTLPTYTGEGAFWLQLHFPMHLHQPCGHAVEDALREATH